MTVIVSSAESTLQGTVQAQKQASFIPPNSGFETVIKSFDPAVFKNLSDSLYNEQDYLSTSQGHIKVKAGNFDNSNSPLSFRTYLTLYTQDGTKNNVFQLDRDFYVSKSIKTSGRPQGFIEYSSPNAAVFYNSKRTGYGSTMTGMGVAAAVVGAAALSPDESQK